MNDKFAKIKVNQLQKRLLNSNIPNNNNNNHDYCLKGRVLISFLSITIIVSSLLILLPEFQNNAHGIHLYVPLPKDGPPDPNNPQGKFITYGITEVKGTVIQVGPPLNILVVPDENYRNLLTEGNVRFPEEGHHRYEDYARWVLDSRAESGITDEHPPLIKIETYGFCKDRQCTEKYQDGLGGLNVAHNTIIADVTSESNPHCFPVKAQLDNLYLQMNLLERELEITEFPGETIRQINLLEPQITSKEDELRQCVNANPNTIHPLFLRDKNGEIIVDQNGEPRLLSNGDHISVRGLYVLDNAHPLFYSDSSCKDPFIQWYSLEGLRGGNPGPIQPNPACYNHAEIHPFIPSSIRLLEPLQPGEKNTESHMVVAPVPTQWMSDTWELNDATIIHDGPESGTLSGRIVDNTVKKVVKSEFFIDAPPKPVECQTKHCIFKLEEQNVSAKGPTQNPIEDGFIWIKKELAVDIDSDSPCSPIKSTRGFLNEEIRKLEELLKITEFPSDIIQQINLLESQIASKEDELQQCVNLNPSGTKINGMKIFVMARGDDILNPTIYQADWSTVWEVDNIAPKFTSKPQLSTNVVGAQSNQITIDAQMSDNSGVKNITAYIKGPSPSSSIISQSSFSLSSGDAKSGNWQATLSFPTNAPDGEYVVEVVSFDISANSASDIASILLDRTPPVVKGSADRLPDSNNNNNDDGWYNKPITITWTGDDGQSGSGIKSCEPSVQYSTPDAASITVKGHCTDNADNVGEGTVTFNYDSTPPETAITLASDGNNIAMPLDGSGTTVSNNIALTLEYADSTSGIAYLLCSIDGQSESPCNDNPAIYTKLPAGTHTIQVRAMDAAGNVDSTPASFKWTIITPSQGTQMITQFIDTMQGIDNGIKNSLAAPLGQAGKLLNDNNPNNDKAVCNQLNAFINHVTALTNKKMSQEQSAMLIQSLPYSAQAIKTSLGCQ